MCVRAYRPEIWQCYLCDVMIRREQNSSQAVLSSELHRSVLEFNWEAVDVELHIKLHVREKPLEESLNTEQEWFN